MPDPQFTQGVNRTIEGVALADRAEIEGEIGLLEGEGRVLRGETEVARTDEGEGFLQFGGCRQPEAPCS